MGVIFITPIFLSQAMEDETPKIAYPVQRRPSFFSRNRLWLNGLLFIITVFTTFFVGISWSINYKYAEVLGEMNELPISLDLILDPQILLLSLLYAVVLLGILLGHDKGPVKGAIEQPVLVKVQQELGRTTVHRVIVRVHELHLEHEGGRAEAGIGLHAVDHIAAGVDPLKDRC